MKQFFLALCTSFIYTTTLNAISVHSPLTQNIHFDENEYEKEVTVILYNPSTSIEECEIHIGTHEITKNGQIRYNLIEEYPHLQLKGSPKKIGILPKEQKTVRLIARIPPTMQPPCFIPASVIIQESPQPMTTTKGRHGCSLKIQKQYLIALYMNKGRVPQGSLQGEVKALDGNSVKVVLQNHSKTMLFSHYQAQFFSDAAPVGNEVKKPLRIFPGEQRELVISLPEKENPKKMVLMIDAPTHAFYQQEISLIPSKK